MGQRDWRSYSCVSNDEEEEALTQPMIAAVDAHGAKRQALSMTIGELLARRLYAVSANGTFS